jgi:PAS domain S-box-containing protein
MAYPYRIQVPLNMEQLTKMAAKSSSPVIVLDRSGKVECFSESVLGMLGYDRSELARMTVRDLLPNIDDFEAWLDRRHRLNSTFSLRKPDGSCTTVEISFFALDSPQFDQQYYVLIMNNFVGTGHLNIVQQFSGTFMQDINLGVLLMNADFCLVDISDMACRILGMKREEIINRPMEEVFAAVPQEYHLVQRTILDGLTVRNHAVSWTNNQERYELLMDSNLLKDENGEVFGAYVIFKDVTNLRSLEEQVQRSDRLAMIGQIAAGTAHEIRNPLTSIKGFLQVFKKLFEEKGFMREHAYTEIMLGEIDRINDLVNEFLLLSKPKNSVLTKVNVSDVIRTILPIINNEAILHDVVVQYEAARNLPPIIADAELIKQVCLNICKNGIEAMGEGGVLTIAERVDEEEQRVLIEIRDTGPGIPAFLIDKIFDPFFTTKENGTGLGLAICQRIIHDIGGVIRVSSKGYGTTFTICIPYPKW